MHYQSDITGFDDRLWTQQELEVWLAKKFKGVSLLLPDDSFYKKVNSKDQLINLADKIQKHLKIRQNISYGLSETVAVPGKCSLENKKLHIIFPTSILGKPLLAAACAAHLLAHAMLLKDKKQQLDNQDNERFTDMATIQAGLGIIVLNGINQGGWRTKFRKKSLLNSRVLGYFTTEQYINRLNNYLKLYSIEPSTITKFIVPWQQKSISPKSPSNRATQPNAIKSAANWHKKSITWFYINSGFAVLAILFAGYISLQPNLTLDKHLVHLETTAKELKASYESCTKRYMDLQESLPKDDIASSRLLSYEQYRCKSIENRYNSASQAYNQYLAK